MSKTIALITDFGQTSHYVGTMKGVMLSICSDIMFVDICHDITPQNITEAAFVLKESYPYFPKGTVFLVIVDPGVGSNRKGLIIAEENYSFVLPDNGIIGSVFSNLTNPIIYEVSESKYFLDPVSQTFHGRDIFAPVAAHMVHGISLNAFGSEIQEITLTASPNPIEDADRKTLSGEIVHIDRFGNLISNIPSEDLIFFKDNLNIRIKNTVIASLSTSYSQVGPGEFLAIISSGGHLEIASRNQSAKELLQVKPGDKILINFGQS